MATNQLIEKRPKIKLQTAIEYLSIYAWALIILVIAISVIAFLSLSGSNSSTYLPSSCYISAELNCQQMYFMSNSTGSKAFIFVQNNMGANMSMPANAFTIQPGLSTSLYSGNCYPANAIPGTSIECVAFIPGYNVNLGTQLNPKIQLSYWTCTKKCIASEFESSGSSTVYVSGFVPTFSVELQTSTGTGAISVDGVRYSSNANVIFLQGVTYSIVADPPRGYAFSSWSNTVEVDIPNSLVANATANAVGPGTITANFMSLTGITMSFQSATTQVGAHDVGSGLITGSSSSDTVVICAGSNAGGTLSNQCSGPYNYKLTPLSSVPGEATYDTDGLTQGTYYFEACDLTYYTNNHNTKCSAPTQVLIEPQVTLTVASQTPGQGLPNAVQGMTSASTDNVVICDDNYAGTVYYGCGTTYNQELAFATGTVSLPNGGTEPYPAGTYTFIACDSTYYGEYQQTDCSPTNTVSIEPQIVFTFACNPGGSPASFFCNGNTYYETTSSSDLGTGIDTGGSDSIVICSSYTLHYQGSVNPAVCAPIPGSIDVYQETNTMTTPGTTTNATNNDGFVFNNDVGPYYYEACDSTYYHATGRTDCSSVVTLNVIPNATLTAVVPNGKDYYRISNGYDGETNPPSFDTFVMCDNNAYASYGINTYCPAAADQQVASPPGVGETVTTLNWPAGTYDFLVCDITWENANPGLYDCSSLLPVTVTLPDS